MSFSLRSTLSHGHQVQKTAAAIKVQGHRYLFKEGFTKNAYKPRFDSFQSFERFLSVPFAEDYFLVKVSQLALTCTLPAKQ